MSGTLSRQQRIVVNVMKQYAKYSVTGMTFVNAGVLCYTKRIQELRDLGYDIETTPSTDGCRKVYYTLHGEPKIRRQTFLIL